MSIGRWRPGSLISQAALPQVQLGRLPSSFGQTKSSLEPFDVSLELSSEAPVGLRVKVDAPMGTPLYAGEPLKISLRATDGSEQKSFSVGDLAEQLDVCFPAYRASWIVE